MSAENLRSFWSDQRKYWQPDTNAILGLMGSGARHVVVEAPNKTGKSTLLKSNLERSADLTGREFAYADNWAMIHSRVSMSYVPTILVVDEFARAPLSYSEKQARSEGYPPGYQVDSYLQRFVGNENIQAVVLTAASTRAKRMELADTFGQVYQQLGGEGQVATYSMKRTHIPDEEVACYFEILDAPQEVIDFVLQPGHQALRTPGSLGRFEKTREGLFSLKYRSGYIANFIKDHPHGIASVEDLRDAFTFGDEWSTWKEIRIGGSFPDFWRVMVDLGVFKDHPLVSSIKSLQDALEIKKLDWEHRSTISDLGLQIGQKQKQVEAADKQNTENRGLVREVVVNGLDLGAVTRKHLLLRHKDKSLYIDTSADQAEIEKLQRAREEVRESAPAELPFQDIAGVYFD